MTALRAAVERATDALFAPRSVAPMAAFRVVLGLVVTVWTLSLFRDVFVFFGPDPVAPRSSGPWMWSVFFVDASPEVVAVGYALLLVAAIAVVLGWHTRLAALVMFVMLVSFSRQNPWVYNSGDGLLRVLSFYLLLMPAGAAYSLDMRRRTGDWATVEQRAPWPLWLVRVQVAAIYLATALAKMPGSTWTDGTAVGIALRLEDLARLPVPAFVTESLLLVNLLTFFTLAFEIVAGVLVWPKATRYWILAIGVMLHGGILLFLQVGPFSWAIFAAYLSFVEPRHVDRAVARLRRRPPTPEPVPVGADEAV